MKYTFWILFTSFLLTLIFIVFQINVRADNITSAEYKYYIDNDNQVVLTKYLGSESNVTIPSTIDGYKVKATEGTFYDNEIIKKVTVSDGIKVIGDNTFFNCANLCKVSISDSVEVLGNYAFANTVLKRIRLSKNTSQIGKGCFYGTAFLKFVKAEAEPLYIGDFAFDGSGIQVMQLTCEPFYSAYSFSGHCVFAYNPVTSFLRQHEPLGSLFHFLSRQSALKKGSVALSLAILTSAFVYLLYRFYCLILSVFGKNRFSIYKSYNKKSTNFAGLSDNSDIIIFKKKSFLSDMVAFLLFIIIIVAVYLNSLSVVVLFVVDYLIKRLNIFLIIILAFFSAVVLLILYILFIFWVIKTASAINSFIGKKYFGRSTRSTAKIRKIREDH